MAGLFIGAGRDISGAITEGLQTRQQLEAGDLGLQGARDTAQIDSLVQGALQVKQIQDPQQKIAFLQNRRQELADAGISTEHTDEGIALLQGGQSEEFEGVTDQLISLGTELRRGKGASARAFAPNTVRKVVGQDEKGEDVFGLFNSQVVFDPSTQTSKVIETPIEGDLVTSTGETITQRRLEDIKAAGATEAAKTEGKAVAGAKTANLVADTEATIATAVKLAEKAATDKGETLTELKRSEAALPGLRNVISQLKELAPIATSTLGGRVFDSVVKESGFGSTKGADARAKFISIVNNQVLPLLKPTFGAAFTEREGEALKATMGDPNATPAQKIVQLNSFIDQKVRDIQGSQRKAGQEVTLTEELTTGQSLFSGALNRDITEQDISDTLQANPGTTREQLLQQLQVQ